jgi:hypothetical protein
MSHNHGTPSNGVMHRHPIEQSPNILYTPTFGIHVNQTITHKDIRLVASLDDLFVHMPTLFTCHIVGKCMCKTPTKVARLGSTPSNYICRYNVNACCLWPHFTCPKIMALKVTILHVGIMLNILQAFLMLPHLAYMSTRLLLKNTFESKPFWTICSRPHMPF